jgi:hypothetical protein
MSEVLFRQSITSFLLQKPKFDARDVDKVTL